MNLIALHMVLLHANSDALTRNSMPRGLLHCREGCLATRKQTWVSSSDRPTLDPQIRIQLSLQLLKMSEGRFLRAWYLGCQYLALFGLQVIYSHRLVLRRRLVVGILRWVNLLTLSASCAIDAASRLGFNRPLGWLSIL